MKTYLYLSLMPESLIASMLPPEEFGNYFAVGTKKRTRGQAMFFEVNPDFESEFFPLKDIEKRCVPHADGTPKRSLYLSIYRVLEHLPLEQLKNLYLVTDDGRVLGLEKQSYSQSAEKELHLYQQLCPVTPRVASRLNPLEFCRFITDTTKNVSVPKIVFVEMMLDDLAKDPVHAKVNNIPYPNIDHLRDCLIGIQEQRDKNTKTVIRYLQGDILYRTCKNGFFVGDQNEFLYYPFPSKEELEDKFHSWWRSALTVGFRF